MGTMLSTRGVVLADLPGPSLNLSSPDVVTSIHRAYLEAGATLIETNTYGCSKVALERYGLQSKAEAILKAGAELALKEAANKAFVAGAIGPIGVAAQSMNDAEIVAEYALQARALIEAGLSILVLETFSNPGDFELALKACRDVSEDVAIIGQFAFTLSRMTPAGLTVERMVDRLNTLAVDVIGANCGGGESAAMNVAQEIVRRTTKPVSILPNRGLAQIDDEGNPHYQTGSDYFAIHGAEIARLGVNIVGGCCGTSPWDIRALAEKVGAVAPAIRPEPDTRVSAPSLAPEVAEIDGWTTPIRQTPASELRQDGIAVIAEVDPPRGMDVSAQVKGAARLVDAGVDSITIADNPLSVMRMSNLALATLLIRELDANITLHMACRDRNMIGTQSHLLGAAALGITNILAITGDPIATQSYRGLKGVFDQSSVNMMKMIAALNRGEFLQGKQARTRPSFAIGGAFNAGARGFDAEVRKAQRKVDAGATYLLTQPVFRAQDAEKLLDALEPLGVKVFVGVMPLLSERNAEFLHNEVPGIVIPDEIRERMRGKTKRAGRDEGATISRELIESFAARSKGVYLVAPMDRYGLTAELVDFARGIRL